MALHSTLLCLLLSITLAAGHLLADALEDEHVRVDRHADREHDAGDARQRQRCFEQGHDRSDEHEIDRQRHVRRNAEDPVVDEHEREQLGGGPHQEVACNHRHRRRRVSLQRRAGTGLWQRRTGLHYRQRFGFRCN